MPSRHPWRCDKQRQYRGPLHRDWRRRWIAQRCGDSYSRDLVQQVWPTDFSSGRLMDPVCHYMKPSADVACSMQVSMYVSCILDIDIWEPQRGC
jgi:hypothetical protein